MKRVVVGVDGSENSIRALEWAAREARSTSAELVVVHAWTVPVMTYNTWLVPYIPGPDAKQALRESAKARVEEMLSQVDLEGLGVDVRVVEGHPGHALVTESQGALMVVVGHGGRRALAELVLGSTTQYVTRHAAVPVTVVPTQVPALAGAA